MPEKKTVLFVDDEKENFDDMMAVVKRRGYNVLFAENPQVALGLLGSQKVDVVLTDIYFRSDGVPPEKLISECVKKNIGVGILTGAGQYSARAQHEGIPVIYKPADPGELFSMVHALSRITDPTIPDKKTVLVLLDDDLQYVHMFDFALLDGGYNIRNAGSSYAIEKLLEEGLHADIVVTGKVELSIFRRAMQHFSDKGAEFVFLDEPDPNVKIPKHRVFRIRKEELDPFKLEGFMGVVKEADAAHDRAKLEKKTLLYIEDDTELLNSLQRNLSTEPYKVLVAKTIRHANNLAELFGIDMVLVDLKLKGSTREETVEFLRMMQEMGVKIIFLTGAVQETKGIAEKEALKGRFFGKPVHLERLRKAIDDALLTSPDWGKKEVLVLEDEPIVVRELEKQLGIHGFQIRHCETLGEVRKAIDQGKSNVAIFDIFYNRQSKPSEEFIELIKYCVTKGVITNVYTGSVYDATPKIDGVGIFKKTGPFHEIAFELKRRIIGQEGKPQSVSDEELHKLCDPAYHMSSPVVKYLDRILNDPDASKAEKELALLSLKDMPMIKEEITASARDGNWSKRDLNDLMERYQETLERLSWLRHKLHGTQLPEELKIKKEKCLTGK